MQALLDRHESYMADTNADRAKMLADIARLEKDKLEVQAENARIIQENRSLVDQLEDMNQAITESDDQIQTLTTTLESTRLEIRRLAVAASRAAEVESQLSTLEMEQDILQEKLANSEECEKSAVQRWKRAEVTLKDLQYQLDKMETESRREHQKHVELLDRVGRDSETGRPKGTASSAPFGRPKNGTNVVSHFVRDILQDNTGLQMSIVELRGMLQNSDEEIRNLQEQILLHQPLGQDPNDTPKASKMFPLSDELQPDSPTPVSQEFHIHHHYHGEIPSPQFKKDKQQLSLPHRRKKRRPVFPPTLNESPTRGPSDMRRTVSHGPQGSTSSNSTAFSSLSIPSSGPNNRWSSSTAGQILSSSPGSPQSAHQPASIFDRVDRSFESSGTTSPESSCVSSPVLQAHYRPRPSDTFHSISEVEELDNIPPIPPSAHQSSPLKSMETQSQTDPSDDVNEQSSNKTGCHSKPERLEEGDGSVGLSVGTKKENISLLSASMPVDNNMAPPRTPCRSMKRSTSHESLISVSGMDIHSSVASPRHYHKAHFGFYAKKPSRMVSAGTIFSSVTPIVSHTNATVPRISVSDVEGRGRSSVSILSSITSGASTTRNSSPSSSVLTSTPNDATSLVPSKPRRIGNRVGGWVLERLGGSPSSLPPREAQSSLSSEAGDTASLQSSDTGSVQATLASSAPSMPRVPGVNQKGSILWLRPPPKAPTSLHPTKIDEELLQESLQE